ncbi:MAG: permease-like cell division protein FtsX [Firmicutes bacterium]|nr:permease-like cell division protein FtsX [Bacillota bacterium]
MKMKSFRYIFPQTFKSMLANGWMTFAAVMTITISLFLCTLFWLLVINVDANATALEEDVRISAYIKEDTQDYSYDRLYYDILAIEGVEAVEYISREDGLKNIAGRFGNTDLLAAMGGVNPLPDCYSITAESKDHVASIAKKLEGFTEIDDIRYGEETVDRLFALTDTLRIGGLILMLLMAVAAVVLISMSIRLTVMARKKEIMVMKWTGATNAFIRWPFILEGLFLGLMGAVLALGLALVCYNYALGYIAQYVSFLVVLPLGAVWQTTVLFALGAGLLLGMLGSFFPLARFLDV